MRFARGSRGGFELHLECGSSEKVNVGSNISRGADHFTPFRFGGSQVAWSMTPQARKLIRPFACARPCPTGQTQRYGLRPARNKSRLLMSSFVLNMDRFVYMSHPADLEISILCIRRIFAENLRRPDHSVRIRRFKNDKAH
jgi:hypothetical protein